MRFPTETRALIHEAGSNPVTIPWPKGMEPKKGRVYWLQSEEDAKEAERKEKARREHSPETCAEVLAGMRRRFYGDPEPKVKGKRRRQSASRPRAGDPRILVIDTTILEIGWEAKVALYEDPDPVRHSGIKAKVPGGPNHLYDGIYEPVELEPEQVIEPSTHQRRREEEEALVREHKASIDAAEVYRAEQHIANLRKRGKRSKLAEEAAKRARRRAEVASAGLVA